MEERLLALLDLYALRGSAARRDQVLIQSFSDASLRRIHELDASLPLIQLFPAWPSATIRSYLDYVRRYAAGIGPSGFSVVEIRRLPGTSSKASVGERHAPMVGLAENVCTACSNAAASLEHDDQRNDRGGGKACGPRKTPAVPEKLR